MAEIKILDSHFSSMFVQLGVLSDSNPYPRRGLPRTCPEPVGAPVGAAVNSFLPSTSPFF
jgi:hypothetical protein